MKPFVTFVPKIPCLSSVNCNTLIGNMPTNHQAVCDEPVERNLADTESGNCRWNNDILIALLRLPLKNL
jgi:hypothetical protein